MLFAGVDMQTEVKLHRVSPDALLRKYVERRLNFVLARFGSRIGRVTARIGEASSGSADELVCRMSADLQPFGVISAEAADMIRQSTDAPRGCRAVVIRNAVVREAVVQTAFRFEFQAHCERHDPC
jgi:hypothetical protein